MLIRLLKAIMWSFGTMFLISTIAIPLIFGGFEHAVDYFVENYLYDLVDSYDDNGYDESDYSDDGDYAYDDYDSGYDDSNY